MLRTAGTTVRSRRKLFNRQRSISPFSSLPLEAAYSDTHMVTDSFHGYWVYPSSPPSGFVPLLGYSYSPLPQLAPYCHPRPSNCHGRARRLRSVVVLHCLAAGCQRLGFLSNGCKVKTVFSGPRTPLCSSFIVGYLGFHKWFINYFFCQVFTARVFLLIPPCVFI